MCRIGDVARRLGISPSTLRNWEKLGYIPKPRRTPTGYRVYREGDILRIERVLTGQVQGAC